MAVKVDDGAVDFAASLGGHVRPEAACLNPRGKVEGIGIPVLDVLQPAEADIHRIGVGGIEGQSVRGKREAVPSRSRDSARSLREPTAQQ